MYKALRNRLIPTGMGWRRLPALLLLGTCLGGTAEAATINVSVVEPGGTTTTAISGGFKWLLEEDRTVAVTPGTSDPNSISFSMHASHAPAVKQGTSADVNTLFPITDVAPGRYFVTVLPHEGYTMSGASVEVVGAGDTIDATIVVHPHLDALGDPNLKAAQISIYVFEDNHSINGAPDLPVEQGLGGPAHNFSVLLFDAAGQYGAAGGQVTQDINGNPLGTEYDAAGTVTFMPGGGFTLRPDAGGVLTIKNLPPAKYGVQVVPPAGEGWSQTSTIEGSKTIDAWVKTNEPSYFAEFGPPGPHVFVGFVKTFDCLASTTPECEDGAGDPVVPTSGSGSTLSGTITNNHLSRSPDFAFYSGHDFPSCRVGLNLGGVQGRAIVSQPCDADSGFSIDNVPQGTYSLSVWDDALSIVISAYTVTVDAAGNCSTPDGLCDLGEVPVFNWFGRIESSVFFDRNQNGFRDCPSGSPECDNLALDDVGLGADQSAVLLRFRDGRIYQGFPVDGSGEAPFDEVFPFFHWLVAEVDFATLKATGATFTVDAGGPVAAGETLRPQAQRCTASQSADPEDPNFGCTVDADLINVAAGDNLSRTDTGPVLTQAFQAFLGQTQRMEFGKGLYSPGENGGISGITFYAITRAEDDPRFAAAEEWEPGVPRAQVSLYEDRWNDTLNVAAPLGDGIIDEQNGVTGVQLADTDNYPLGWAEGGAKGDEDIDVNGNGSFDLGDAIRVTWADSWDDSVPTGCQGPNNLPGLDDDKCFDGLRNFNQVRPGVFDGGWAFGGDGAAHVGHNAGNQIDEDFHLAVGTYIVHSHTPAGYEPLREEHRNVDFGDEYGVTTLQLAPLCVGGAANGRLVSGVPTDHTVPDFMAFLTKDGSGDLAQLTDPANSTNSDAEAPFAGDTRPLCDTKQIRLGGGQNPGIDFFVMSHAPKAAHVVGGVINDLANEFDPNAPTFGEKYAPPWLPVSIRDWAGVEITRTYTDEFGKFNALLPSTYTVNAASPSGVVPNMLQACMNDAGTTGDIDPWFNKQYSQFCYVFQYMPGGTTYLDTPVVPIAAFAAGGNPLDCEAQAGTPMIKTVTNVAVIDGVPKDFGPYVNSALNGSKRRIRIRSMGRPFVPNPAHDDSMPTGSGNRLTVRRDYRFGGAKGSVHLASKNTGLTTILSGTALPTWNNGTIIARVPAGFAPGEYQLLVERANGEMSPRGITLQVGPFAGTIHEVTPSTASNSTQIQDAIDAAAAGDLILVKRGVYNELPIMHKPVKLQGSGPTTVLNGRKSPASKLQQWRTTLSDLLAGNGFGGTPQFDLLPGQETGFAPGDNEPVLFFDAEGAGITVVANDGEFNSAIWGQRIDGFTVTGADHGGGIFVNGYARHLQISNNVVESNQGTFGGGIRLGHTAVIRGGLNNDGAPVDALNDDILISYNHIAQNGNLNGAGAGVSVYTGADRYEVSDNFICGNFANTHGGGIGHLGLSRNGLIENNDIVFNQNFKQGQNVDGGGIYIGGDLPLAGETTSPGAGRVTINANLIQGNNSVGDGAGIAMDRVNGDDVVARPNSVGAWHLVDVFNNMIVNNVAGYAGGGVSLRDTLRTRFVNNTIANNDSTATSGAAFTPGVPNESNPQVAGLVSREHVTLAGEVGGGAPLRYRRSFSNPVLKNNILWHNRSFHVVVDDVQTPSVFLLPNIDAGDPPVYDDLARLGTGPGNLIPRQTVFSESYSGVGAGHSSNLLLDGTGVSFAQQIPNGNRNETIQQPETTAQIDIAIAFDEGGNFIDVRYGPLSLGFSGDYHINPASDAIDEGHTGFGPPTLDVDFDDEVRPQGGGTDIGADEAG